jgi:hypothetical protein
MKLLLIALTLVVACVSFVLLVPIRDLDAQLMHAYEACGAIVLVSWIFGMLLHRYDQPARRIE